MVRMKSIFVVVFMLLIRILICEYLIQAWDLMPMPVSVAVSLVLMAAAAEEDMMVEKRESGGLRGCVLSQEKGMV